MLPAPFRSRSSKLRLLSMPSVFLQRQQALFPRGPVFIPASPEFLLAVMQRAGSENTGTSMRTPGFSPSFKFESTGCCPLLPSAGDGTGSFSQGSLEWCFP